MVQRVKGRHSSFHKNITQPYCHQFHGEFMPFSSSYSSVSVIWYCYKLGDFVKDFNELSMILISYELELNPGIKSNPTDQRKC